MRRHGPVLRAAAKRGLGSQANTKLLAAVKWLGGRIARMKARASDAADNVYLELAVQLGDAAPEGAKGGKHGTEVYWAHRLAVQARAVLDGEDAEDEEDEEDAPLPATRPRRKVVYASDADEDEGEAFVAVGGDGHDSEEDGDYDAPMLPKKRKRAAAARAKPVKKPSGRRR